MFMKLLLTLLVIAGAIGALRLRKRQPRRPVKSDINENHLPAGKSALPRIAAYGALGVMLLGCAVFIYLQLQDAWQVVTVRIIDAGSGRSRHRAYKGDVSGRSSPPPMAAG